MTTELLTWHPASTPPDAELTVLLCVQPDDGSAECVQGWYDGEDWRACESGGVVRGAVQWWCEPVGPEVMREGEAA